MTEKGLRNIRLRSVVRTGTDIAIVPTGYTELDGAVLTRAQVKHLRRLVGWIRCEAGQTPEELVETVRRIAPAIQDISEEGKGRLIESYREAKRIPKYLWAAIKALDKIGNSK